LSLVPTNFLTTFSFGLVVLFATISRLGAILQLPSASTVLAKQVPEPVHHASSSHFQDCQFWFARVLYPAHAPKSATLAPILYRIIIYALCQLPKA
jgi:hypothetical protein